MKASVLLEAIGFENLDGVLKWCHEEDPVVHIGCDAVLGVVGTLTFNFRGGFGNIVLAGFDLRPFDWHPLPNVDAFTFELLYLFNLLHAFVLSVAANRGWFLLKKTIYSILYHFFVILSIVYNKKYEYIILWRSGDS